MKHFSHFSAFVNTKNKNVILRISFTLIYCMFDSTKAARPARAGVEAVQNKYINFADTPCGVQQRAQQFEQQQLPPSQSSSSLFSVLFRSAKIIPGDESSYPGEFPWIVSFRWNNNGEHFCAGSIISKRYIVSAAHCFTKFADQSQDSPPYPYRWMEVTLGDVNLVGSAQMKHFGVDQVWVHPRFNRTNYSNDIAIVQLTEDIEWGPFKQPVCLPLPMGTGTDADDEIHKHYDNPNKMMIAGWGSTNMGPGPTNLMRKASIDSFYKKDECQQAYSNLETKRKVEIVEEHLCAGGRSKHKIKEASADACFGDSGGPLMLSVNTPTDQDNSGEADKAALENVQVIAIGIISAGGSGCAKYPGIYARISKYIDWIKKIVPQSQALDLP